MIIRVGEQKFHLALAHGSKSSRGTEVAGSESSIIPAGVRPQSKCTKTEFRSVRYCTKNRIWFSEYALKIAPTLCSFIHIGRRYSRQSQLWQTKTTVALSPVIDAFQVDRLVWSQTAFQQSITRHSVARRRILITVVVESLASINHSITWAAARADISFKMASPPLFLRKHATYASSSASSMPLFFPIDWSCDWL